MPYNIILVETRANFAVLIAHHQKSITYRVLKLTGNTQHINLMHTTEVETKLMFYYCSNVVNILGESVNLRSFTMISPIGEIRNKCYECGFTWNNR